jgi:hypothetical protein
MMKIKRLGILLLLVCCGAAISVPVAESQQATDQNELHGREFWKSIVKNNYAIPSKQAFPLAQELNKYLGSTDPELRDDLAYSILSHWIVDQDKLSPNELLTLLPLWEANLHGGIGESGTDSIFTRSFSVLCLAAVAERDLKEPFLGPDRFRTLLDESLTYLDEERDLRAFSARKGWMHATAHTADLLVMLARNPLLGKQDQARILAAITKRLATANIIFSYGEQDRLANVVAAVISRKDFDGERWHTWVTDMDKEDQAASKRSPRKLTALNRFENDTYFVQGIFVAISCGPSTPATAKAKKTILAILHQRSEACS